MVKKRKHEEEISKEKAFKAVYEYATWGALFHTACVYIRGFFRFVSDIFNSFFR